MPGQRQCKVRGCEALAQRREACQVHYSRMRARGTYVALKDIPFEQRFWKRVSKSRRHNGCWMWTGAQSGGYGYVEHPRRKRHTVHRLAWTLINGPIPAGHIVKHQSTCISDACCRPDHMYLERINQRLHLYCKNGKHLLTAENTLATGRRRCKACDLAYRERRRRKERLKREIAQYRRVA